MTPYGTNATENDVPERLIRVLGSCLPEDGMDLILMNRHRCTWTSCTDRCDRLLEEPTVIEDMMVRIDDGDEPALTRVDDVFVVGVPLLTPCCDYGYALLVLYCVDDASLLKTWSSVECVLNQMQCIAGLLEMQDDSVPACV